MTTGNEGIIIERVENISFELGQFTRSSSRNLQNVLPHRIWHLSELSFDLYRHPLKICDINEKPQMSSNLQVVALYQPE